MDLAAAFSELAVAVGSVTGAPYWPGKIVSQATLGSYDIDGTFVPGSVPAQRDCTVQIDVADWAMRNSDGFVEGMVRFIVLSASFTGTLDADANITVSTGPHAGEWLVSSLELDPAGIGYVGRGRVA